MKIQDLTEALSKYLPDADISVVEKAYEYSAKAHQGQSRRSGEAYISHPLEVANNLVKLKMDETTLAAGLLHDTIEDTLSTPKEIQKLFGDEIFQLVDGVTKISKPKPGDTVVITGAAGGVGSIAGQIFKISGCKVIGIAGGKEKCKILLDEFGFDAAID